MTVSARFFVAVSMLVAVLGGAGEALALGGRILSAASGAPVQDASVTFAGGQAQADKSGAFHLPGAGETLFARAPGYRAKTVTAADLAISAGVIKLTPFTPKALYLTVYGVGSNSLRESAMALIRNGSANALVIDVKGDRGIVPYPSAEAHRVNPSARKVTTIPDLAAFASKMHAQGVYLIARIVTFKDDPLATTRPELAVKRNDGRLFRDREGLAWTDPFQADVRAYNIALAVEAGRAGFDEIQFDYLRFPDSSARLSLAEPSNIKTRTAAIAGFLADARRQLATYNVYLAADIFGYVCWNEGDTGIGQALEAIAPNVDYLSPMLYPSGFQFGIRGVRNPVANSYVIVRQSLAEAQMRLKIPPTRFRPWLQAFRDYAFDRRRFDADEVAKQIRAAEDFGSDGWMLWNASNVYSRAGLAARAPGPRSGLSTSPSSQASCS
jgi:hypothetical protein